MQNKTKELTNYANNQNVMKKKMKARRKNLHAKNDYKSYKTDELKKYTKNNKL